MTRPATAMTPAIMAPATSRPGAAPLEPDGDDAGVVLVAVPVTEPVALSEDVEDAVEETAEG